MKWLLLALVIFVVLTIFAFRAADRPGDDFGAALPALFCGAISAVLGVLYIGLAFWNHRFF